MPESPPKRMTRARAKAVESTTAQKPAAKAAARGKAAATAASAAKSAKTTTTKRKTRTDDANVGPDQDEDELQVEIDSAPAPARSTRGRKAKAKDVVEGEEEVEGQEMENENDAEEIAPVQPARSTRGRPKRATATAPAPAAAPRTRATRGAMAPTASSAAAAAATVKRPPIKKVTFQDMTQDKENQLLPAAGGKATRGRAGMKSSTAMGASEQKEEKLTGLRAKPVRRPAAARTTRRKQPAAVEETKEEEGEGKNDADSAAKPLSPKKAKQIATAATSEEDDELAGPKTPMKARGTGLNKSPMKNPASTKKEAAPTPKSDGNEQVEELSSPSKSGQSDLNSPARRPPSSPYKDTLRESPKKCNLAEAVSSGDGMQSMFTKSPFKDAMKESPKKPVHLADPSHIFRPPPSGSTSAAMGSSTPFRSSLLQSPARRPPPSTLKRSTQLASAGPIASVRREGFAGSPVKPLKMPAFSPAKAAGSPVKRVETPMEELTIQEPVQEAVEEVMKPVEAEAETEPAPVIEEGIAESLEVVQVVESPNEEPFDEEGSVDECPANEIIIAESPTEKALPQESPVKQVSTLDLSMKESPVAEFLAEQSPVQESPVEELPTMDAPVNDTPTKEAFTKRLSIALGQPATEDSDIEMLDFETSRVEEPMASPSVQSAPSAFHLRTPTTGDAFFESGSEDELQSSPPAEASKYTGQSRLSYAAQTPLRFTPAKTPKTSLIRDVVDRNPLAEGSSYIQQERDIGMTPLAEQLAAWRASSPEKTDERESEGQTQGTLSKIALSSYGLDDSILTGRAESPAKAHFFDDEMSIRGQESDIRLSMGVPVDGEVGSPASSFVSDSSQEYGDENEMPIDPMLLEQDEELEGRRGFCTPERVFPEEWQERHTVSKVPLKEPAEDSPSQSSLNRSASCSASLSRKREGTPTLSRSNTVISYSPSKSVRSKKRPRQSVAFTFDYQTPTKPTQQGLQEQQTPASIWSKLGTPGRTPRSDLNPQLLRGAVIYVDVHTSEGADASGIFIELLTQMGARCVKQWNWNPSPITFNVDGASPQGFGLGGSADGLREVGEVGTPGGSGQAAASGSGKIGITHVLFKDGGKRTLEKVRESRGIVQCVGVGWVLDCETENKWLDEAPYSVDTNYVPRGGHNRRKSMEPRALSNINGHVVPSTPNGTSTTGGQARDISCVPQRSTSAPSLTMSPTKEFMNLSSSPAPNNVASAPQETPQQQYPYKIWQTPDFPTPPTDSLSPTPSPSTPYYLQNPAALTQQTCPPKQRGESLFQSTGSPLPRRGSTMPNDEADDREAARERERREMEAVRRRLLLAKRKTLQFVPKVGSPLARGPV
ncbi:MAG: hydrolase 76 protein [Chaenotheca gracillima]|nr:MAG: hydrolase 76 protein [Chaenotheca gracillima]